MYMCVCPHKCTCICMCLDYCLFDCNRQSEMCSYVDMYVVINIDTSIGLKFLFKQDFEVSEDRLKTLLETVTLYLPRLSSQKMLNGICPLDGSSR